MLFTPARQRQSVCSRRSWRDKLTQVLMRAIRQEPLCTSAVNEPIQFPTESRQSLHETDESIGRGWKEVTENMVSSRSVCVCVCLCVCLCVCVYVRVYVRVCLCVYRIQNTLSLWSVSYTHLTLPTTAEV